MSKNNLNNQQQTIKTLKYNRTFHFQNVLSFWQNAENSTKQQILNKQQPATNNEKGVICTSMPNISLSALYTHVSLKYSNKTEYNNQINHLKDEIIKELKLKIKNKEIMLKEQETESKLERALRNLLKDKRQLKYNLNEPASNSKVWQDN